MVRLYGRAMRMRLAILAVLVLASAAFAVPSATGGGPWHKVSLRLVAYGTRGWCSHRASEPIGACHGVVEHGYIAGHTVSGRGSWAWNHHEQTLTVVGENFHLRGKMPNNWGSFSLTGYVADKVVKTGSAGKTPSYPDAPLHVLLVDHTGVNGQTSPGYTLHLVGYVE
jgi:hypothetical protein